MNKYRVARKENRTFDGITFDSKKEMLFYIELKGYEKKGIISNIILQPCFILQESFKYKNETQRMIKYCADFQYDEDGITYIVDVKGMQTDVYKIKKKLFLMTIKDKENIIFMEM